MARALRILLAGGWYHVTSRGNRREAIYRTDADRTRFLGLVAELPDRFGLEVHAFVLMDNHYHLLVRTPEPNLSEAMRWLHVSYSSRFNWANRLCGHVFQGRYKAMVIEDLRGVAEVARYVHLNPVRVGRLGLDKTQQWQSRVTGGADPGAELVRKRLRELKEYRWSSWRVYQGAEASPGWLQTGIVGAGCGGRNREERRQALREYTETPVRQGRMDSPWTGLIGGLVLGSQEYAQGLLKGLKSKRSDGTAPTPVRQIQRLGRCGWPEIVAAAEAVRGKRWGEMVECWGDWGRDGTSWPTQSSRRPSTLLLRTACRWIRPFRKASSCGVQPRLHTGTGPTRDSADDEGTPQRHW
jgi:REP element-mobilizing transposase RayT